MWTHGGAEKQKIPLGFYVATLLLNLGWAPLFFKARKLDLVLITAIGQLPAQTNILPYPNPPVGGACLAQGRLARVA